MNIKEARERIDYLRRTLEYNSRLYYENDAPEIPDYEVGGENKEFFHKVFIYLGQYRDRIPNGLLVKIYQYTLKRPD